MVAYVRFLLEPRLLTCLVAASAISGCLGGPISDNGEACSDCIRLEHLATIGAESGAGMLETGVDRIVRDQDGRIWIGQPGQLKVYDRSGFFLRSVGREGQGPLEFQFPSPIAVDSAGTVHVLDVGNARYTAVNRAFELADEAPLRGGVRNAIGLGGNRFAAAMTLVSPETLGLPLHIFHRDTLVRSFGLPVNGRVHPLSVEQVFAIDRRNGRLLTTEAYVFRVVSWSDTGEAEIVFEEDPMDPPRPAPGAMSPTNPPRERVVDIYSDDEGLLWVLRWRPTENWRSGVEEIVQPDGEVAYRPRTQDLTTIFETFLQVIDLDDSRVVASQAFSELYRSFTPEGELLWNHSTGIGEPLISIFHPSIER